MSIADRIQNLRKAKGISQEELADKIGVSRQAVSKWESDASYPEPEKIILLSDFFQVSTDYLLKGEEQKQQKSQTEVLIFAAVGTALNAVGLIIAVIIWMEERSPVSVAAGLILMVFGCMIFAIGQFSSPASQNGPGCSRSAKWKTGIWFWLINIWLLTLMPLSCIFNFVQGTLGGHWWTLSPLPQLGNFLWPFLLCWAIYLFICITADILLLIKVKR